MRYTIKVLGIAFIASGLVLAACDVCQAGWAEVKNYVMDNHVKPAAKTMNDTLNKTWDGIAENPDRLIPIWNEWTYVGEEAADAYYDEGVIACTAKLTGGVVGALSYPLVPLWAPGVGALTEGGVRVAGSYAVSTGERINRGLNSLGERFHDTVSPPPEKPDGSVDRNSDKPSGAETYAEEQRKKEEARREEEERRELEAERARVQEERKEREKILKERDEMWAKFSTEEKPRPGLPDDLEGRMDELHHQIDRLAKDRDQDIGRDRPLRINESELTAWDMGVIDAEDTTRREVTSARNYLQNELANTTNPFVRKQLQNDLNKVNNFLAAPPRIRTIPSPGRVGIISTPRQKRAAKALAGVINELVIVPNRNELSRGGVSADRRKFLKDTTKAYEGIVSFLNGNTKQMIMNKDGKLMTGADFMASTLPKDIAQLQQQLADPNFPAELRPYYQTMLDSSFVLADVFVPSFGETASTKEGGQQGAGTGVAGAKTTDEEEKAKEEEEKKRKEAEEKARKEAERLAKEKEKKKREEAERLAKEKEEKKKREEAERLAKEKEAQEKVTKEEQELLTYKEDCEEALVGCDPERQPEVYVNIQDSLAAVDAALKAPPGEKEKVHAEAKASLKATRKIRINILKTDNSLNAANQEREKLVKEKEHWEKELKRTKPPMSAQERAYGEAKLAGVKKKIAKLDKKIADLKDTKEILLAELDKASETIAAQAEGRKTKARLSRAAELSRKRLSRRQEMHERRSIDRRVGSRVSSGSGCGGGSRPPPCH